jgi:hypothetical protein
MEIYAMSKTESVVSVSGYADLIKASWILIDIINQHPQFHLSSTGTRYDVQLLAAVS